jgi:hypothetical protein
VLKTNRARELNARTVGQIAHKSSFDAKNSCDRFRLRVKRAPLFGCLISLLVERIDKQRSTTELTTDPHSRQVSAEDKAPKQIETRQSCGFAPSGESRPTTQRSKQDFPEPLNAGVSPAFFLRAQRARRHRARGAGFISVSGQCAARSALSSDLRRKRISGGVAATEHLRAPMNSPPGGQRAVQRVSFLY